MAFHNPADAVKRKPDRPPALVTSELSPPVRSKLHPAEIVEAAPQNRLDRTGANDANLTAPSHGWRSEYPPGFDLTSCQAADERPWGVRGFNLNMLLNAQQQAQQRGGLGNWASNHDNAPVEPATTQYTGDLSAEPSDLHCADGPGKISPHNRAAIGLKTPLLRAGMSNMTQYTGDDELEPSLDYSRDRLGASRPATEHLPSKNIVVHREQDSAQYSRGVDLLGWRSPPYS
ncbi:hypothetical protein Vretifemale_6184, partial [Volvox reticuliferus]